MRRELLIARNPEPGSTLPYLVRVPVPGGDLLVKARETWPRTTKVYCHRMETWPQEAEMVERCRSARASGAARRSTWSSTGHGRTARSSSWRTLAAGR